MSFRRPAAAVLATLLGTALALALAGRVPGTPDRAPDPRPVSALAGAVRATVDRGPDLRVAAARGPARAIPGAAPRAVAPGGERGPSCDPGGHGHGEEPVAPTRAVQDHGQLAAGRPAPEGAWPDRGERVRVPVRGPGQRAPKPVELSVMRV